VIDTCRECDVSGVMRLLGLGTTGLATWWVAEYLAGNRQLPAAPRRFTGSRLDGLFSGNRFPVTQSLAAQPVEIVSWHLNVAGEVASPQSFSYDALLALPSVSWVATLDCTLGWYSTQTWSGIPLPDLLSLAGFPGKALAVRFESITGIAQLLPWVKPEVLLPPMGGEPLVHDHGFLAGGRPRRGWFWVGGCPGLRHQDLTTDRLLRYHLPLVRKDLIYSSYQRFPGFLVRTGSHFPKYGGKVQLTAHRSNALQAF
jgi:hypothetical protein